MKTCKKILIAVCAVVLAVAVIVGILYAVLAHKVPDLEKETLRENPISFNSVYVVVQAPYTDRWVFDTPIGMNNYWIEHKNGGNGIEIVLQQTKDGELIMLSEPLPAKSNAEDLYGINVKVSDLTLEELRKINLAYDLTDEDGAQLYVEMTDDRLASVSVVTLEDVFDYFGVPARVYAKLFLRFYDESQITDLSAALQTIYDGLKAHELEANTVFCPQSDACAAVADTACPDLARAATTAEAKALYRKCLLDKTPDALPYTTIFEKVNGRFGSEKFIHYAGNLGIAVVLADVPADDVVRYRSYGVTAFATSDVKTFIQILKDAKTAERESKKAAG